MKYRVVHFDPMTWQEGVYTETRKTLEEAEQCLEKMLKNYPLSKRGEARIEEYNIVKLVLSK